MVSRVLMSGVFVSWDIVRFRSQLNAVVDSPNSQFKIKSWENNNIV
ncbi:hypothetical protein BN8_02449 [Fibrisoma limi BUZ 3]|uniref:Uncharacterized protein n=1 Tax=Fibrisoma limi BUZ 3 TaxID=1185876 RepID=I2GHI3_9BACT|nr:hypothetical protein BN8_02449 [Fibrisoma limi BUZ 3]